MQCLGSFQSDDNIKLPRIKNAFTRLDEEAKKIGLASQTKEKNTSPEKEEANLMKRTIPHQGLHV